MWTYDTEGSGLEPAGLVAEIWMGCMNMWSFSILKCLSANVTWTETYTLAHSRWYEGKYETLHLYILTPSSSIMSPL